MIYLCSLKEETYFTINFISMQWDHTETLKKGKY